MPKYAQSTGPSVWALNLLIQWVLGFLLWAAPGRALRRSYLMCIDNSLILHIYIIVRKNYHTYFELIHAFYIWFWNNVE